MPGLAEHYSLLIFDFLGFAWVPQLSVRLVTEK
jgi:hypothetical protein